MSRKGGGEIEATRRACPFTTALKLASPTDAKLAAGSRFAVGRGANFPSAVSQGVAVTKHERMQKKMSDQRIRSRQSQGLRVSTSYFQMET